MWVLCFFFFQAEDGIRDLVRSRGLGDVYKRQAMKQRLGKVSEGGGKKAIDKLHEKGKLHARERIKFCLLYTSDAADERSSVDLGGRRIIKKKTSKKKKTKKNKKKKNKYPLNITIRLLIHVSTN